MMGTRAMSGSDAIRFRKRVMAACESSMASSMLMSMICAPFSTCWRATASASSNCPLRMRRANALEPVTLVRSPMLTKSELVPMETGSRPESFIGATGVGVAASVMAAFQGPRNSPRPSRSGERRWKHRARAWQPVAVATLLGRGVNCTGLRRYQRREGLLVQAPRPIPPDPLGDLRDVLRRRAATATRDVEEARLGELLDQAPRDLGRLVEAG